MDGDLLEMTFDGELFSWRGPSPFHFVSVPDEPSDVIRALAPMVTYGWGVIPVTVTIGRSTWTTSLFPRDGRYLVPVKDAIRKAEQIAEGDIVTLVLTVGR